MLSKYKAKLIFIMFCNAIQKAFIDEGLLYKKFKIFCCHFIYPFVDYLLPNYLNFSLNCFILTINFTLNLMDLNSAYLSEEKPELALKSS